MKPLLTRAESRAFDARALTDHGLAGITLMENAGRGAFEAMREHFPQRLEHVVCVGGPGQNGGDAWVVARHLIGAGFAPEVWLVGEVARLRGDAKPNWEALGPLGVPQHVLGERGLDAFRLALARATLVVDGLFGTGLDRPLVGEIEAVIRVMGASPAPCVALDLPSGVDADTGAVLGVAPQAALTLTFAAAKPGLFQYPGAGLAGRVEVVSLGVPGPTSGPLCLLERADLGQWLTPRRADAHKGSAGRVLVVAGSPGKSGAAWLAARGAFRAGAGLVHVATRDPDAASLMASLPEAMLVRLADDTARERVEQRAETCDALVLGPGLGLDEVGRALTLALSLERSRPMVVDADALTHLAQAGLEILRGAAGARVLTPHPGEAARLLGCSTREVQADRLASARALAARSGQVAVLKGAGSIIASPTGEARICDFGTPAMATAGSGDVLAGVVGALLLDLPAFDAASAGVVLHALAGEEAAIADRGLLAREIADAIPRILASSMTA